MLTSADLYYRPLQVKILSRIFLKILAIEGQARPHFQFLDTSNTRTVYKILRVLGWVGFLVGWLFGFGVFFIYSECCVFCS